VPGVTAMEPMAGVPGGMRFTVAGEPDALVRRLAEHRVVRLRTVEPSLEEIFLTYY
jgi:ABC-2 type transport system ATP-binding protein